MWIELDLGVGFKEIELKFCFFLGGGGGGAVTMSYFYLYYASYDSVYIVCSHLSSTGLELILGDVFCFI